MNKNDLVIVAGAGGFIGGHLVKRLVEDGYYVRSIDKKKREEWHQFGNCIQEEIFDRCDLSEGPFGWFPTDRETVVFNLAADMGGIGFITTHKADCMLNVLINTNLLMEARENRVKRFFYASSACVYPHCAGEHENSPPIKERCAYPADPEDGYGWEKLFSERMCRHFREDYGLETRVGRLHNCYGPHGSWNDGREKAPAAICRKVALAAISGKHEIEIWGDGAAKRSFMYIDDCVRGILNIAAGDNPDPVNLGSGEMVSINQLVDAVEAIAGVRLQRKYVAGPRGIAQRNSDNTEFRWRYGWEPSIKLADGLEKTYRWIYDQVARKHR